MTQPLRGRLEGWAVQLTRHPQPTPSCLTLQR